MNALQTAQTNYAAAQADYDAALKAFYQMITPYETIESDESREIIYAEAYAMVGYEDALSALREAEEALVTVALTTVRSQLTWEYGALLDFVQYNRGNLLARRRLVSICMRLG